MALVACPECQREVSTHAKACPHCGCPIAPPGVEGMWSCSICGAAATRACAKCGRPCCENHVAAWHTIQGVSGRVCTKCRDFAWNGCIVFLIILVIAGLAVYFLFIRPEMEKKQQHGVGPNKPLNLIGSLSPGKRHQTC